MNHQYKKVKAELIEYVRTVLVLNNYDNAESSNLPLFTKGMPALLCKIEGDKLTISLYGQSVPDDNWTMEDNAKLIAFFFKPFSLGTIFKLSAKELKEKPVELNRWNAQKTMAVNVQLFHASSIEEKIEVLNSFIFSQVQTNQRDCEIIQYATDKLMQDSNTEVLVELLKELNLTERTFQRIFKKYVGITANEYRRICQFYFAFSQLKGNHFDKQTDIAYDNGYFDQSHYIRSFKEFTDTTPKDYLQFGLNKKK